MLESSFKIELNRKQEKLELNRHVNLIAGRWSLGQTSRDVGCTQGAGPQACGAGDTPGRSRRADPGIRFEGHEQQWRFERLGRLERFHTI